MPETSHTKDRQSICILHASSSPSRTQRSRIFQHCTAPLLQRHRPGWSRSYGIWFWGRSLYSKENACHVWRRSRRCRDARYRSRLAIVDTIANPHIYIAFFLHRSNTHVDRKRQKISNPFWQFPKNLGIWVPVPLLNTTNTTVGGGDGDGDGLLTRRFTL